LIPIVVSAFTWNPVPRRVLGGSDVTDAGLVLAYDPRLRVFGHHLFRFRPTISSTSLLFHQPSFSRSPASQSQIRSRDIPCGWSHCCNHVRCQRLQHLFPRHDRPINLLFTLPSFQPGSIIILVASQAERVEKGLPSDFSCLERGLKVRAKAYNRAARSRRLCTIEKKCCFQNYTMREEGLRLNSIDNNYVPFKKERRSKISTS
jgi:hypothetical protein